MTEQAALRAAIAAEPDEDTPRLAYADWLDENRPDRLPSPAAGPSARAEFIRVQCRLAAGAFDSPAYPELREREHDLAEWLNTHARKPQVLVADLLLPEELETGEWGGYRRGFAEMLYFNESCVYGDTPEETVEKIAAALEGAFTETPARTLRLQGATADEVILLVRHPVFSQLRGLYLDFSEGEADDAVAAIARSPHAAGLRRLYFDFLVGAPGLTALARSRHLGNLESLAIDFPVFGKPMKALAQAKWLRNLRRLHLWPSGCDALRAVAEFPRMPRLISLTLRSLTGATTATIRRFVASRSFPNLAHLDINDAYLSADKVAALARGDWPLRHLSLGSSEVRKAGAEALASAAFAPTLRVLDLCECEITAGGVQALAGSDSLSGLRHLDLSHNPVGTGGLAALAESPAFRGLRMLNLRRTNTLRGPITARAVTGFLSTAQMPELRHLDLNGLPVGLRGSRVLADDPKFVNLTWLGLERCAVGEEGLKALTGSKTLTHLVGIALGWNKLGTAAAKLASPKVFPRLAHCYLDNNRLSKPTLIRLRRRRGIKV